MDKTIVTTSSFSKARIFLTKSIAIRLAVSAVGFFIGRTVIFDMVNPIAVGFMASITGIGYSFYATAFFLLLGIATKLKGIHIIRYLICVSLLCIINVSAHSFLNMKKNLYFTAFAQGLSGALCILIGTISVAWMSGAGIINLLLIAVLESTLAFFLVFVLCKATALISDPKGLSWLGNEEIISVAVLLCCIIAGSADIYIWFVSLKYFLCFYFILLTSYFADGAVAAAAGMLIGIMLLLTGTSQWNASMALVLSLSGLGGGLFKSQGKLYAFVGFVIVGGAAFFYLNRDLLSIEVAFSMSFAGMLFMITPWKWGFRIASQRYPDLGNNQEYASKIRGMAVERLEFISQSFARLGHKFGEMASISEAPDKLKMKFSYDITPDVCDSCEFNTYKAKKNTLVESRELISRQFAGISGVIKNLSDEIDSSLHFNEVLEERIFVTLAKNKIDIEQVTVLHNKFGRCEVNIKHPFYHDKKLWNRTVIHTLNSVLGRKMQADENEKVFIYNTRFIEEKPLQVSCGAASAAKGITGESGDSYSFIELKSGHMLLVISDGMGSGVRARNESAAAVDLLENFLESGFDKKLAVNLINSVLALNNSYESFATLDICLIDLYTGDTEFIKLGAAAAYLMRDDKVFFIRSSSLPIGMLKDVEIEVSKKKLYPDDILVMVTDGLAEAASQNRKNWIAGALRECHYDNPQEIADYLLLEAKRMSDGEVRDDMTVLAARVLEKY